MKFKKEDLRELRWGGFKGAEKVYDKITGQRRWVTEHECVFSYEGKFYMTCYDAPSTEVQEDMKPYEGEGDEIECPEVVPVERTVTVYEEKPG